MALYVKAVLGVCSFLQVAPVGTKFLNQTQVQFHCGSVFRNNRFDGKRILLLAYTH